MARSLEHCDHPLCLSVSYFGTMPEVHDRDEAHAAEGVVPDVAPDVAPDDVVGQVLQSGFFQADVSLGPKPPPIHPGGLVAGLLSGRIGDLGLQKLGPKQPGFPPPGSAAAKLAAVVHRSLPVPPPDPGVAASSSRPPTGLQPLPLPPPPPIAGGGTGKGSETGKGYGPQTGRSQEPHPDDFAWAFKRGDPPSRFRKDGP